ncbi:MAG: SRPBCC domain-containing protein [Cyclobacteriaceae bacterium]
MIITKKGATESIIHIEETFRAPREKVFKAWTKPVSIKKWFMADEGVIVTDVEVNLRVGGTYFIEAAFPGYDPTKIDGEFLRVEQPTALEYTWLTPVLKGRKTKVDVTFEDSGNGSKIRLSHGEFEDENEMQLHIHGWKECLSRLSDYLGNM